MYLLAISTILATQQVRLPSANWLGEKMIGKPYPKSELWLAKCQKTDVQIFEPARQQEFFVADGKRGALDAEKALVAPVVSENLFYQGQPYQFVYLVSALYSANGKEPYMTLAPLVAGENYLIWSSPFNGIDTTGSFLEIGPHATFGFNIPTSKRTAPLRLARCRIRTVGTTVPKDDVELMKLLAQSLKYGGADARDAATFMCNIRGVMPELDPYMTKEFPKYMLQVRDQYSDSATRAFCSYMAFYLGGYQYQSIWLDDMASLSFKDTKIVDRSCLSCLSYERFRGLSNGFNPYPMSDPALATEKEELTLTRFKKAKDDDVRYTLLQYVQPPQSEAIKKQWIKIFVNSGVEAWTNPLSTKLAEWVKNPALKPVEGRPLEGLRQQYKDIYLSGG